jgi:serine protease Do
LENQEDKVLSITTRKITTALMLGLALSAMCVAPAQAQAAASVRGLPDFTELVEQVGPSVVNIRTTEKVRVPTGQGGDEEMQELFKRFFGTPMPNAPRQSPRQNRPPAEESQPKGQGSGFVLTSDGYIMTNAHVVDGADEVLVTLTDKREFKAKIIGADKRTDVAVVKIAATGLPAVKVGDVGRLKVGEWVMAIGSPFGLENSVTAGIVSAKQRDTGAHQHARRGGGHQQPNLFALGRLHGHRVCHPHGRSHPCQRSVAHQRARQPRPHRCADRPSHQRSG